MSKSLMLKPRVSEKAYALSKTGSTYVFVVSKAANRQSISKSVAEQFSVTVEAVRTLNLPPKAKRTIRKRGRNIDKGFQPGYKKAYVTIKKGETIPVFAVEDEKPKKEPKTERGKK